VISRRLSIIMGYLIMGTGFLVEGFFPAFVPILLAQVLWGLGHTFTSGATEAWISDEIGEQAANKLFLRATRLGLNAALTGMGLAILVGAQSTALPIRVGAAGVLLIGLALGLFMPETGFHPTPREERNTWQHMWHTLRQGLNLVRGRPRLMAILGVGLFYGLYSEGFDRLWVRHMLDAFDLPVIFGQTQIGFLGLLRAGTMLLSIFSMRLVEKRLDLGSPHAIGRAMLAITALLAAAIVGFALSPIFPLTIVIYWAIGTLRNVANPVYTAWANQKLEPATRATVLSMSGQVDAFGQIAGGPAVGLIARTFSVVAAITTSGLLLTPALWLVGRANSHPAPDVDAVPVNPAEGTDPASGNSA